MTTEFDLDCTACGSPLTRSEVSANSLGFAASNDVEVAECPDCGERYFPEATLKQLRT